MGGGGGVDRRHRDGGRGGKRGSAASAARARGGRGGRGGRCGPGAAAGPVPRPRTDRSIDRLWHPDMAAAIAYARSRVGDIAFAVRTPSRFYGYRPDHQEWSASVVKAMLLVTYLDSAPVRDRALTARDTSVLGPMIRISDNDDAQIIFDTVGQAGLAGAGPPGRDDRVCHQPGVGRDTRHPA